MKEILSCAAPLAGLTALARRECYIDQHRVIGKALALLIGAVLCLGVFFLARFLTRLPDLVILGSELMLIFLFGLIRAFWGPLAKHKAVRNVWIVRALP